MGAGSSQNFRKAFKAQSGTVEQDILEIFQRADTNGNGVIEVQELADLFETLGIEVSESQLYGLMAVLDVDRNGSVSYEEFLSWLFEKRGKTASDLPGERWCPKTHPRRGVLQQRSGLNFATPACALCQQTVGRSSRAWFCNACKDDGNKYTLCASCYDGNASSVAVLRQAGADLAEMRAIGFDAGELKAGGYLIEDLKQAGFVPKELALREAYSIEEMLEAGYTLAEFRGELPPAVLRPHGFEITAFKEAGYEPTELKDAFTVPECIDAGFTLPQLYRIATVRELVVNGFAVKDLRDMLVQSKTDVQGIIDMAGQGQVAKSDPTLGARELREAGCRLEDLKDAGYSVAQLKAAGFRSQELKDVGFTLSEMLFSMCVPPGELKAVGFTAADMRTSCLTMMQLKNAGWTVAELSEAFTINDFETGKAADASGGWEPWRGPYSLAEVRQHYTPADFKAARYSCVELGMIGFTLDEFRQAGFHKDGRSALDLRFAGFEARELQKRGYSEVVLSIADRTLKAAAKSGTLDALRANGIKAIRAEAAAVLKKRFGTLQSFMSTGGGCTYEELANEIPLSALFRAEFSLADMGAAGIDNAVGILFAEGECSVRELARAGASLEALQRAGAPQEELERWFPGVA